MSTFSVIALLCPGGLGAAGIVEDEPSAITSAVIMASCVPFGERVGRCGRRA